MNKIRNSFKLYLIIKQEYKKFGSDLECDKNYFKIDRYVLKNNWDKTRSFKLKLYC